LDKLRIELCNSKSYQKFLEDQLLKKEKIKAALNQQLRENDEWLKERKIKYDDLVNKHVMMEEELVTLKKASKSRKHTNKKLIAFLKKDRNHYKLKWKAKKKNKLANLTIEE